MEGDEGVQMRRLVMQEIAKFSSGLGCVVAPLLGQDHAGHPVIFTSVQDGSEVGCWDIDTGETIWHDNEGVSGCNDQVLVPIPGGGFFLVVATEDGIEWWDGATGQYRSDMAWDGGTIWSLSVGLSAHGRPLVFGAGHDGAVYHWDGLSGDLLGAAAAKHEPRSLMAISFVSLPGDSGMVVAGDDAGFIRRWSLATGREIGEPILAHASQVRIIETLQGVTDPLFVSCDQDGSMQKWNAVSGVPIGRPIESGSEVYSLSAAKVGDAAVMFTAGEDEIVRMYDVHTNKSISTSLRSVVTSSLNQSNGATLLATSTGQGDIVLHRCSSD
ncbi:WD40 repeat domain-containing protein [Streptomyces sp. T12]|uniref:WD40 repeat domain-containing protein n=1 Tax=Streptomyces sp. T12 TaxID=477697 RepID=UPI001644AC31|nr:WD40 repeat domain-containing protein [Streptomyces sp. T12]